MNKIEIDNKKHLDRFKNEPPSPSYISGFIDGDGSIFIRKIKNGFQTGITLTQCRTNILQIIQYHFGGSITTSNNRNKYTCNIMKDNYYHKYNKRNQYNLMVRSNEYELLLNYIKDSIILKKYQIDYLYDFYKLVDIPCKDEDKNNIYNNYLSLKTNKNLSYNFQNINIEYISGLFDAEGCVFINNKTYYFYISITQKNNIDILNHICNFLNFGKVKKYNYIISNKQDCLNFIAQVKKYSIVKYNQLEAFEKFLETNDMNIKDKIYRICNEEKHIIENFVNLNQTTQNKDGYYYTMNIRNIKQKICNEIKLKNVYKLKSQKMMGEGNHNYGKKFSEETKNKMSISIRNAKNGISDENILKVRELISIGKKNIEIQKELNLSRDVVSKIKNRDLLCRNENKIEKNKTTQQERNIKKRKITIECIFYIIDKIIEELKPSSIYDNLLNNNCEVTIDIIKNIKRKMKNNIMPFYDFETTSENYNKYKILINEYNSKKL